MSLVVLMSLPAGCSQYHEDIPADHTVEQVWELEDLAFGSLVQFQEVFWDPDDTASLRRLIIDQGIVEGRDVMEIGCGTGLLSIVCLQNGADSVVATDINPAAVANTKYNAAMLDVDKNLDVRLVTKDRPQADAALRAGERFDVIVSNPPWENGVPARDLDHAFYDSGFALMKSLLDELPKRLRPGGRCLLVYGNVTAIKELRRRAQRRGYALEVHDDRDLDMLPENFMPGMLLEVIVNPPNAPGAKAGENTDGSISQPPEVGSTATGQAGTRQAEN